MIDRGRSIETENRAVIISESPSDAAYRILYLHGIINKPRTDRESCYGTLESSTPHFKIFIENRQKREVGIL